MKVNSDYRVGVVVTCTDNSKYTKWIPYVIRTWKMLGIDTILLGINFDTSGYKDCFTLSYKNTTNIENSSISQVIRLLYPSILTEFDAILIADIDQVPLPNEYFKRYIKQAIEENTFVGMRFVKHEYFMGWNVAPPNVWKDLTRVSSYKSLINTLSTIYTSYPVSWGLDQILLKQLLYRFPNKVKVENLDLYGINITDTKLYKQGLFEKNKKYPKQLILDLNEIDKSKFIGAGTATGTHFNDNLLTKVINFFYNEDIL